MTLETLFENQQASLEAGELGRGYVDQANRKSAALERIQRFSEEYELPLPADPSNEADMANYLSLVQEGAQKQIRKDLRTNRDKLLNDVPAKDLADKILQIKPYQTGNKDFNRVAGLSEKLRKYDELARKLSRKEIGYDTFAKEIVKDIEEEIMAKLDKLDWADEKYKEKVLKVIKASITNNSSAGDRVLGYLSNRYQEQIREILPEDDINARANYVKANLRAGIASDKDEALDETALTLYSFKKEKEQEGKKKKAA